MDKYLPFVTIDTWTLIFTWCNLLILFFLMKKFLFTPISNILKQRDEEIKGIYDDAEKSRAAADANKTEYEKRLSSAKAEAAGIIDNAVKNASLRSDDIIHDAEKKASDMIIRADKQIKQERIDAMNDIKSDISSISAEIAGKLIGKDMSDSDHMSMIDELIDEIGEEL